MGNVLRVIAPAYAGNNVLTDVDPSHYSLFSDSDNVLIKEFIRGSGSIALNNTATIAHNLSYVPFFIVYAQVAAGRYRISSAFDPLGSGWRARADNNNLEISNFYDANFTNYYYYIFYDNFT